MTVVFFVWPADALAAQIITMAYGTPVVDRIQIPAMRPHRLDQGKAVEQLVVDRIFLKRRQLLT